jgi:hypothetical protein
LEVAVNDRLSLLKILAVFGRNPDGSDRETAGAVRERFAFTAIMTETGAMVARVLADSELFQPQGEHGCFESWTEAQSFAALLNQQNGIAPIEAQDIIVGATLAARIAKQSC